MNRQIKFRAWNKDDNRTMFYSENGNQQSQALMVFFSGCSGRNVVIMQYTGLNDKNGKEIYEGDIVKFQNTDWNDYDNIKKDYIQKEFTSEVEWNKEYVCFEFDNDNIDFEGATVPFKKTEIIGNIYENPE